MSAQDAAAEIGYSTVENKYRIHGRVQGVGLRSMIKETAALVGLSGTVRNSPDGTVELIVRGPESVVDDFILWLDRNPGHSRVDKIEHVAWALPALSPAPQGAPEPFQIVYSNGPAVDTLVAGMYLVRSLIGL